MVTESKERSPQPQGKLFLPPQYLMTNYNYYWPNFNAIFTTQEDLMPKGNSSSRELLAEINLEW